jgi:hypothetical protein
MGVAAAVFEEASCNTKMTNVIEADFRIAESRLQRKLSV